MTSMNPLREQRWLILVAVLVVVFLGALSMHMERMVGWGFLVLCFIVGSVGGLGYMWGREQFLWYWNRLPKSRRRIAIAAGVVLYIIGTFIADHHQPNEGFDDAIACFFVLFALLLWGLYRIMSRFLDAIHERFFKH